LKDKEAIMIRQEGLAKITRAAAAVAAFTLVTLGFVLTAGSAGRALSRAPGQPERMHEVRIENFSFSPATLTVSAGTKVTWVNRDDVPHTVVSRDKKIKSGALDTDQQFIFTFTEPGTYDYYCSLHPKMTGKVVVQ
jgi:amicyanin